MNDKPIGEVAQKWIDNGADYDFHIGNRKDLEAFTRASRAWKKIFHKIGGEEGTGRSAFEFGCGGGQHLVMLASRGWNAVGIDCIRKILDEAGRFLKEARVVSGKDLNVRFVEGDFMAFDTDEKFDLVFHNGVLEHFLEDGERFEAIRKMFAITKPGGYVVSMIPSGMHPLRRRFKSEGLGGYGVPEIDYTDQIMAGEFEKIGVKEMSILPHNIFGYLLAVPGNTLERLARRVLYYAFQLVPAGLVNRRFAFDHCGSLIGIARKPSR